MARKPKIKHEEHENHERWLVSYADFITLLFAFFVVMYSISSVNEGKYRVLSDALVAAFRAPPSSMQPIQVGKPAHGESSSPVPSVQQQPIKLPMSQLAPAPKPTPQPVERAQPPPQNAKAAQQQQQTQQQAEVAIKEMAEDIERAMRPLIDEDLIKVKRDQLWMEIEINSSILFDSGSARFTPTALPVLEQIAMIMLPYPNPIHIEGHTDNLPIATLEFPSNWELSTGRAASVVRLFAKQGILPTRMAAIGFGEFRPMGDNETPEGRARNRRVVMVVHAGDDNRVAGQGTAADRREPAAAGAPEATSAATPPAPEPVPEPVPVETPPRVLTPDQAQELLFYGHDPFHYAPVTPMQKRPPHPPYVDQPFTYAEPTGGAAAGGMR